MNVTQFSKEIIKIGETLVAISTIYSVSPVGLTGMCGYGPQYYGFEIKTCLGQDGKVTIFGEEINYGILGSKELTWGKEDEHPLYADKKIELLVVRDEVVAIWNKYLGGQ